MDAVLVPREPGGQRLRAPDRGAVCNRRSGQRWRCCASRTPAIVPVPAGLRRRTAQEQVGPLRDDLKPLEIVQPDGPSFDVNGRGRAGRSGASGSASRRARGWSCTRSPTRTAAGGGRSAPRLIRRAGDPLRRPQPGRYRTNAYDIGEYGIGPMTNSLELGCDCLGEIRYLDAVTTTARACRPRSATRSACTRRMSACCGSTTTGRPGTPRCDGRGASSCRRSSPRRNYEYAFYWYLYQDGTIETEVKLTGIVLTSAVHPGERPAYGTPGRTRACRP